MKKLITIMSIAALFLSGIVFTSCGVAEAVKETVNDSYNTWYKYNGEKKVNIPLVTNADQDTDDAAESSTKLENADIYFMFNPENGLTVAIQAVTKQNVEVLGGLVTNRMDFVVGSTNTYPVEKFGKAKWAALWGSGKISKDSAPKIYTNPKECINLNDEKEGPKIQWKKFLANYLLNSLLDD